VRHALAATRVASAHPDDSQRVFCTDQPGGGMSVRSANIHRQTGHPGGPKNVVVIGGGRRGWEALESLPRRDRSSPIRGAAAPRGALNIARRVPKLAGIADIVMDANKKCIDWVSTCGSRTYMEDAAVHAAHTNAVIVERDLDRGWTG